MHLTFETILRDVNPKTKVQQLRKRQQYLPQHNINLNSHSKIYHMLLPCIRKGYFTCPLNIVQFKIQKQRYVKCAQKSDELSDNLYYHKTLIRVFSDTYCKYSNLWSSCTWLTKLPTLPNSGNILSAITSKCLPKRR